MKLIIANWKMNFLIPEEAQEVYLAIEKKIGDITNTEIVICPPFVYLSHIYKHIFSFNERWWNKHDQPGPIKMGAQNCFWEESGAFTGEVSPWMLKNLGCEYVILGHSERRKNLGETDEMINKKLKAALDTGLKPILCVGDKSRESEQDIEEIQTQLGRALTGTSRSDLEQIILVYEPVWAISATNGMAASPNDAKKGKIFIQKILKEKFLDIACPGIIYGGSVDSKNVRNFIDKAEMDGVLVGQASLNAEEFIKIIKALT